MQDEEPKIGDNIFLENPHGDGDYGKIVGRDDDDFKILTPRGREIIIAKSKIFWHNEWRAESEDRTILTDGTQVYPEHRTIVQDGPRAGQQKDYIVLSEEERAKGFVRPVRESYKHLKCGTVTTMGRSLAETYARDPKFYSGTFCCGCGTHFPVGEQGEFVWVGTKEKVGT